MNTADQRQGRSDRSSLVKQVRAAGRHAVILEADDARSVRALAQLVTSDPGRPELDDIIPTSRTLYLAGPAGVLGDVVRRLSAATAAESVAQESGRLVTIDVRYDGPDLADVAERTDLTVPLLIELHTSATFPVEFFGFSPGQAFFADLPQALRIPRRSTPRTRVPSGAVAIATQYTTIYPQDSPGGWSLLGTRVSPPLWDATATPPNRIEIGDRVRFRAVP